MNILFICTGNTCRSPLAEKLLQEQLAKNNILGVNVRSAGLFANDGMCMSIGSQKALEKLGITATEHRSTQVTRDMLVKADLILTMTKDQKPFLKDFEKLYSLGEYTGLNVDVDDPYGASQASYDKMAELLNKMCAIIIEKFAQTKEEL